MSKNIENIKDIQNTLWAMYKDFMETHSVSDYNTKAKQLVDKYSENKEMLTFCQNLIITWAPVINALAEEYRGELGNNGNDE